jgi:hypothetical protein
VESELKMAQQHDQNLQIIDEIVAILYTTCMCSCSTSPVIVIKSEIFCDIILLLPVSYRNYFKTPFCDTKEIYIV